MLLKMFGPDTKNHFTVYKVLKIYLFTGRNRELKSVGHRK